MDRSIVHTSSPGSSPSTGGSATGLGAISLGFSVRRRSADWADVAGACAFTELSTRMVRERRKVARAPGERRACVASGDKRRERWRTRAVIVRGEGDVLVRRSVRRVGDEAPPRSMAGSGGPASGDVPRDTRAVPKPAPTGARSRLLPVRRVLGLCGGNVDGEAVVLPPVHGGVTSHSSSVGSFSQSLHISATLRREACTAAGPAARAASAASESEPDGREELGLALRFSPPLLPAASSEDTSLSSTETSEPQDWACDTDWPLSDTPASERCEANPVEAVFHDSSLTSWSMLSNSSAPWVRSMYLRKAAMTWRRHVTGQRARWNRRASATHAATTQHSAL